MLELLLLVLLVLGRWMSSRRFLEFVGAYMHLCRRRKSDLNNSESDELKHGWKTIKIRELPLVFNVEEALFGTKERDAKQAWIARKCPHGPLLPKLWGCGCKALYYVQNNPVNMVTRGNPFYGAFVRAYNNHEDVILSPDDIWMQISLQFAHYVDKHAEALRSMFVEHKGQKRLSVTCDTFQEFFSKILPQIKSNTKEGVVDEIVCDFSTTGDVERFISTAVVMHSFQKYFKYHMQGKCGIANVHFMGTHEDWVAVVNKTKNLAKYAVTDDWKHFIDRLVPTLEKLLETYDGKVDVTWWDHVMDLQHHGFGSGATTTLTGWILDFYYDLKHPVEPEHLHTPNVDVPVEMENVLPPSKRDVSLIGGFGGVCKIGKAYRPQLSLIVFWDGKWKY